MISFPKAYADAVARLRVPSGFLLVIVFAWLSQPAPQSLLIGLPVSLLGLALRAWAAGCLAKNRQLATSGPYAYTRNPLYLGSAILVIGFGVASRNLWLALALITVFAALYMPVVRDEEEFLRSNFPEFDLYAQRVPRIIPRLKSDGVSHARFSSELYRKHREYNAALGSVGMMVLLALKLQFLSR